MNWKTLNRIKRVPLIPFIILARIGCFLFLPFMAILIFFGTDWEDEIDRKYVIRDLKSWISFGFWK